MLRLLTILLLACVAQTAWALNLCSSTSSTASSGSLYDSGGAGSNYSNNESCNFLIQPSGGGTITLSFSAFNVENNYDYVRIYDGTSTSAPLLATLTGTSIPSAVVASSGSMLVRFTSDGSVVRSGFSASWSVGSSCSPYMGMATLNEFFKDRTNQRNDADDFVEVKILDNSIASSVFSNWTLQVCEDDESGNNNDNDGCSPVISVNSFTDKTLPWIVLKDGNIGTYVNFKTGFDAILKDANGDVIDYVQVDGHSVLEQAGCTGASLPYDYQTGAPGASDKFIFRKPDGIGDWDSATSASAPPTEDDTNDDIDPNAPDLSISDASVFAGDDAVFTLTLDAMYGSDIRIDYKTVDGTAVAGTDYTGTGSTQTVTIPAGSLTATITVATASTGSGSFQILLSNARDASIIDQIAVGNIYARPVADYQFEELWNGTAGEVIDSSGNGLDGRAINGANSSNTSPPGAAITGDPGTCRFAEFDGNNQYVSIADNNLLDLSSDLTVSVWIYPRAFPSSDLHTILSKDENYEFHLTSSGQINWWWNDSAGTTREIFTSGTALSLNTWYHVAITYSSGSQKVYIDGVERGSSSYSGNLRLNSDPLLIGTDLNFVGSRNLNGMIDEVKIFSSAFDQQGINFLRQQTHPCTAVVSLDHFDIDHNGNAIYCLNTPVTVTAEQLDNSTYEDYNGSITLNTQSGKGTWTLLTGTGSFNDATPNDGIATYTYSNIIGADDNGVAVFNLYHGDTDTTVPLSINISVDDGSANDDDLEGNLSFSESGFTLTGSALVNNPPNPIDTNLPVATQTAGSDFAVYIAAYGTTPTDPSCGVIESYQGLKSLTFTHNYNDPATGTLQPTINGSAISSAIDVTFTNGQAVVTEKYKDVGQIQLSVSEGGTVGSSNPFVVQPASFDIQVAGNPGATSASGTKFIAAGSNFAVTVQVLDAEGDITPNYGNESAAEAVDLSHALVGPAGGDAGNLTGSLTKTADGTYTGTYQWDEVGIIALTAAVADGDYLSSGNVTSTLSHVGRFIPANFIVTSSAVTPAEAGANPYSYLGQEFLVDYTLVAVDVNGNTVTNYTGAYAKLDMNNIGALGDVDGLTANVGFGAVDASSATELTSRITTGSAPAVNWLNGVAIMLDLPMSIDRDAVVDGPFSTVQIGLNVQDSDNVGFASLDLEVDSSSAGNDALQLSGSPGELRYGRAYFPPVYGPETPAGDLAIPMQLQYWDGSAFVINSDDNSSPYDGWSAACADPDGSDSLACIDAPVTVPGAPALVSGGFNDSSKPIIITRPGSGKTGSLDITVTVDSWLQYDWDSDGTFTDNPSTRVTFGSYRGHDKIIYWREAE
ncbi:hypothetical protein NO559_09750 [Dasania sp. GY-MA-18]|uniref:CUB domain-containing protein n=1 Tax=Dasania phycosphaerae TaxID=2950436 RepID=A0A9J6RMU1_9GAMM|nr:MULTISPECIES: DUF6701 domain-containing protein [Dasania]MCR8923055.1 hypothetical protein [Dasania sp. GY-MA-18]MCZ0865487.1 hypothetical protein [Dasania phycosphaerae]MCZ0869212.1 hypothetical protein [Dasania phycosphaerae]